MSQPAIDPKPGKSPHTRWYVGITLLAVLDVGALVWAVVERCREVADRMH